MTDDDPGRDTLGTLFERLRRRIPQSDLDLVDRVEREFARQGSADGDRIQRYRRAAIDYRAERDVLRLVAGLAIDGFEAAAGSDGLIAAARGAIERMPRVEHGCVFVFDEQGTPEVVSPIRIGDDELPLLMEQISHGIVGQVWRTGQLVYCEEASTDRSFRALESVRSLGMKTVLCVPLPGEPGEAPRGALYVENRTREDAFPQAWRESVQLLASQLSHGLANLDRARSGSTDPTEPHRRGGRFADIVGRSPALASVLARLALLANQPKPRTVLIVGETGVGKELVARALHHHGPRASGAFIPVNTAALQPSLAEAELFGAEKGAYTGAAGARQGLFRAAEGGVLFLDEIGEIPLQVQVKLLRALDEHRIRPVGATAEVDVDVWIVAATNRDLEGAVEAGSFRRDLYFRLAESVVHVPPLRDRPEDVEALATHFAARAADRLGQPAPFLAPDLVAALQDMPLPGNARELRAIIEGTLESGERPILTAAALRRQEGSEGSGGRVQIPEWKEATHAFQARYLRWALRRWPVPAELARRLGINRTYLYKLAARLGVELPSGEPGGGD